MRFGIPSDFDVELGTTKCLPAISTFDSKVNVQNVINTLAKCLKEDPRGFHPQFRKPNDKLYVSEGESCQRRCSALLEKESRLDQWFKLNKQFTETSTEELTKQFQRTINLQTRGVNEVIDEENKRIKDEQNKIRQKQEQERIRVEKERKAKEEEQKRIIEHKELKEKEERQKRLKLEEQLKKKAQEEKDKEKVRKAEEEVKQKLKSSSSQVDEEFQKYKKDILDIKNNILSKLAEDKDLKKYIFEIKRKINPKFGQLSNSVSQLLKINSEMIELLRMVQNSNDLGFKWLLNFIAKAIIDQAETEVTVKPTAALPLARLACSLLHEFKDFDYFLMARFVKKCPYIIGYTTAINTEDGRYKMGWKRRDGKWEDDVKYDERISGICTVWSVMTRTTDFPQKVNFSFESSWKFIARTLNTDISLITNTHFAVVGSWWEVCAKYFLDQFGRQASKLLKVLALNWPSSIQNKRPPAATRLGLLYEDWVDKSTIITIKDMEP